MAATTTTKPVLPWKTRLSLFLLSALSDASRRSNDTINRSFFNFIDRKHRSNSTPVDGVYTSDISVDPSRDLWFRLFIPSSATSAAELPVVLYFHGGGFSFMSPASIPYDAFCRSLSRSIPAIVISVNYRLTPEHRYPSQYDDGFDVLKFLDQDDTFPNADVTKCFLAGDSAGGNIIHHVAVRVCKEKLERVKVLGLISIQPFFGGEERTESEIRLTQDPLVSVERCDWHWKVFLPNGSNRDHGAANVMGPNAVDISGLDYPNTLVLVAGFDPLQDWQRRYYEWLRKSGKKAQLIEYPNTIHGFYVFPELPEGSQFISRVKDFVTEQVSYVN